MKKRLLAALMAAAMAVTMAACGSSSSASMDTNNSGSQTSDTSNSGEHTVAVILKALNSDYWNCVAAGGKAAEKDLGCKVELNGPPSETSYDEQINMIETALGAGTLKRLIAILILQRGDVIEIEGFYVIHSQLSHADIQNSISHVGSIQSYGV